MHCKKSAGIPADFFYYRYKVLKHRICIFCFFWNILDDIPVFDDTAVLDAENVDGCLTAVCGIKFNVVVDEDKIPIGTDMLDFSRRIRKFL